MLRIRSIEEPFTTPRLALKGTAALARADAMGLLEERDEGITLDATIFGRLAAGLRKAGIGGSVVPTLTAVTKEPALLEQCLDQLNDALADTPDGAWAELLRHEEITAREELVGVQRAIWAIAVPDATAQPALAEEVLLGGIANYPACRDEARRLREGGAAGLRAPSSALMPGGAGGW